MTYCVALRLDSGMIFASDSRTNAGVDQIATFSKMRVYEKKDDRVIVVLSSGNLAMTQGVVNILDRHARFEEGQESIWNADSMYDAATLVGDSLREMHRRDAPFLTQSNISVGLPIDLLWYPRDSLRVGLQHRIREGDPYFTMLRSRWGGGLRRVFSELPDPDWLE